MIPYQELPQEKIVLPARRDDKGYMRPPIASQTFVPEKY
jgi:hypothetical protein